MFDKLKIGIDFGITDTYVAIVEKGPHETQYQILENSFGNKNTPSFVTFADYEILVGTISKNQMLNHSEQTIYEIKRLLGKKFSDPDIQDFMKKPIYRAKGCAKCDFTGYKGRLGVYEIMSINKEIKRLVAEGAHDLQIEEAAVRNGMRTLHQSCLSHIINGMTTIDEFVRVLGVVNE